MDEEKQENEVDKSSETTLENEQQQCEQLNTECSELSAVANQISDGMATETATHQSQSSDDPAPVSESAVAPATPGTPPPIPAIVDDVESRDVTESHDITRRGDIIAENGTVITAEEVDLAELKVKVVCQEKANMALRMELKCAELQVAAKEKIDAKKTRLVELLDAKLAQLEKKNLHLVEMMEQMVKEKEGHSRRLVEATKTMEELGRKLAESERVKNELKSVNAQLKTMLENMEGKGTKIAQLAKEKVLKYREENVKMQQQLDQMKTESADGQAMSTFTGNSSLLTTLQRVEVLHRQLTSGLRCAINEPSPTVDGYNQEMTAAMGTCSEMGEALEALRLDAEAVPAATAVPQPSGETSDQPDTDAAAAAASTIADLERQNAELRDAKDREVAGLNTEVKRLKAAIAQLVGAT